MMRKTFLPLLMLPALTMAQYTAEPQAGDLASTVRSPSEKPYEMPAFQAALLELKSDHPKEAIPYLTRELAAHPENGKAWYYRGVCNANVGDDNAAMADLERALELMPNEPNALLRRSELNRNRREYDKAIADLDLILRAHQAGPIAEHALMGIGEIHMRTGNHAEAMATYDRLVAIAPGDARSWFNRGIAHGQLNHHQQAYDDLSKAIKLDGWMYKAYASRAVELIHLERKAEACADWAQAKELGDDTVDEPRSNYCE